ncbi:MAG: response regulator, partial [Verrucomicrobiota bacterium]
RIQPGDQVVLIVEDDADYARILLATAHEKGFKGLIAPHGAAALAMAREAKPAAITLDIHLPDMDGWQVLNRLKVDLATRHIPIQVISVDEAVKSGRTQGALNCFKKPEQQQALNAAFDELRTFVERPVKSLLLVEDDESQRCNISELIGNGDVRTTAVTTGEAALTALRTERFDCMILDPKLPDMSGVQLLEEIRKETWARHLPVIIYSSKDIPKHEDTQLTNLARTILLKTVRSPERLLDETALLLHRDTAKLTLNQRRMLETLHESALDGKKALLVDDDIRNIFAMTSMLERFKMNVVSAENGKDAIDLLLKMKEIDIVLMDIMLPAMDGYATIRAIRAIAGFEKLPIIAVTAKAMKGDREKCIAAGSSDYVAKPVDSERMRSVLQLWLHPADHND